MLILIGFVAGLIAGISPCILPVLPVVLVAGATAPDATDPATKSWRRPVAVVIGLVTSFSLLVLLGSELLSLLGLPQDLLRDIGIALLILVGIGFLLPSVEDLLSRPFARLQGRQPDGTRGGFVIGLALGLVFVPCAGPVLAAITVIGTTHRVGLMAVFVTLAFSIGAAIPLLFVALAGDRLVSRVRSLREHAPLLRRIGGVVLILMGVLIATSAFDGLQRSLPGYTTALESNVEGSQTIRQQLSSLEGGTSVSLSKCPESEPVLVDCGKAPNFTGITAWLNTPHEEPLSISQLKGKVVLVDFWTYTCINCQRTLPHVEAWYKRYAADGLVVVGVHTPEFAFEHEVPNVRAASARLGVHYPVAVDDADATWNAYDNEYWPAEYLIDAKGVVRHVHFAEGEYGQTEHLIRTLLVQAHPGLVLPPPTSVPDLTPNEPTNPETYVGYDRLEYLDSSTNVVPNQAMTFSFPASLEPSTFALSGVWTVSAQEATAGSHAQLELNYQAKDVYLVLGGTGTVQVSDGDGTPSRTISVSGVPRLYTLFHAGTLSTGTLTLKVSPGVQVYDFTFG